MSFETFKPTNVVRNVPVDLLAFDRQAIGLVEGADDFFIALQAERTQEDRRQELPFAINANIRNVLRRLVFELDPRAAIRNDLSEEVALARSRFEKHAGLRCNWLTMTRSVPLMMNVPFSVISGISPK
jgi:DNA-binding cell septation regulator SpoVG